MRLEHRYLVFVLGSAIYSLSIITAQEQQVVHHLEAESILSVHDALKYSSVIPDVLNDFEPAYSMSITFSQSHESVHLGNDIPVASVSHQPAFHLHAMSVETGSPVLRNKTMTLVLTDPDAKSRNNPDWSEMCHWILTNITAPMTSGNAVSKMHDLVEYLPPKPPPKTGKHRYVFVLLEGQEGQIVSTPAERKHWGYGKIRHGVRDWAIENSLTIIGANFFYAQDKEQ